MALALWEKISAIEDELIRRIAANKETLGIGGNTADDDGVALGEKIAVADFRPPFVWIAPGGGPIDDKAMAINEDWQLSYFILGVVESNDPHEGYKEANKLAIRASAFAFIDPDTGQRKRTIVEDADDMVRTAYTPTARRVVDESGRLMFVAGVEIRVRWTNMCNNEEPV